MRYLAHSLMGRAAAAHPVHEVIFSAWQVSPRWRPPACARVCRPLIRAIFASRGIFAP
jgi:hypothetical protein